MTILTVNAGSSSVRLALFAVHAGRPVAIARQRLERDGSPPARQLRAFLSAHPQVPERVAHRVVHGGPELTRSCLIDHACEAGIARAAALAPLHNPIALAWIAATRAALPHAIEVAAFDTAFFAALPEVAATYALPLELIRRYALRRYGFHGLAHEAMWRAHREAEPEARKVISFQLGGGASAAAILDGRPVDTSMGLTPMEGLVMATRSGDLDPGLVTFLGREAQMSPVDIERLLDDESGLLGLSGESSDLRVLLASERPASRLAAQVYVQRARKYLGAYLAVLGGADAILFGGGVGEHLAEVRARILDGFAFCGLEIDPARNQAPEPRRISADQSRISAWVVPVDEETRLAEEALAIAPG
jgi:acetate kinase